MDFTDRWSVSIRSSVSAARFGRREGARGLGAGNMARRGRFSMALAPLDEERPEGLDADLLEGALAEAEDAPDVHERRERLEDVAAGEEGDGRVELVGGEAPEERLEEGAAEERGDGGAGGAGGEGEEDDGEGGDFAAELGEDELARDRVEGGGGGRRGGGGVGGGGVAWGEGGAAGGGRGIGAGGEVGLGGAGAARRGRRGAGVGERGCVLTSPAAASSRGMRCRQETRPQVARQSTS